jgi:hypothetical protein
MFSAVAGWLFTRGDDSSETAWRDDSLDEWRQEREAEHEKAREARARSLDPGDEDRAG